LSTDEVEKVAAMYREFRRHGRPALVPGFGAVADATVVAAHNFALTPGRYVGTEEPEGDDEAFDEKLKRLAAKLSVELAEGAKIEQVIRQNLRELGHGA
jgi:type I restriction enzyme M protein